MGAGHQRHSQHEKNCKSQKAWEILGCAHQPYPIRLAWDLCASDLSPVMTDDDQVNPRIT